MVHNRRSSLGNVFLKMVAATVVHLNESAAFIETMIATDWHPNPELWAKELLEFLHFNRLCQQTSFWLSWATNQRDFMYLSDRDSDYTIYSIGRSFLMR